MIDKKVQWHDVGPLYTLMGIAPENEKHLFDTLFNLPHDKLEKDLEKLEELTKSERLKKAIHFHRTSEFFTHCLPDSYGERKYD